MVPLRGLAGGWIALLGHSLAAGQGVVSRPARAVVGAQESWGGTGAVHRAGHDWILLESEWLIKAKQLGVT